MEKVEGMKISEEERFHVGKRVPLTQQAYHLSANGNLLLLLGFLPCPLSVLY